MDRRIQKTKQSIREAFFSLLWENSGGRITVAEIARKADIDRKTFYLHYDSPEDIFREFSHGKLEELRDLLKESGFFNEPFRPDIILAALNQLLSENLPFYRKLASCVDVFGFWQEVHAMLVDTIVNVYMDTAIVSRPQLELYAHYFASGIMTIYVGWLKDDRGLSLEELGQTAAEIAAFGLIPAFTRDPEQFAETFRAFADKTPH